MPSNQLQAVLMHMNSLLKVCGKCSDNVSRVEYVHQMHFKNSFAYRSGQAISLRLKQVAEDY